MEILRLITLPPFLEPSWRPTTPDFPLLDRRYAVETDCMNENSSQSLDLYNYHSLDTTKQQIRLLKLRPSSYVSRPSWPTNTLQCDLETFDVETAPPYVALSYVWGPSQPTRVINVDGQPFYVRANLFDFLTTIIDYPSSYNYFWIDQISIDQTSINERNHQVRLMSQIYRRCLFVISWLGGGSEPVARRFLNAPNATDAKMLLKNRYFTRVWIVQEIILAPEVHFLCGNVWIPFEDLGTIVNDSSYHQNDRLSPSSWLFDNFLCRNTSNLQNILGMFALMGCQDPHDKIYGLLGLVREDQRPEVDYNKSLHETFLDAIKISLNLYWKDSELGFEIRNGQAQLAYPSTLIIYATNLARDLGLIKGRDNQLANLLIQIHSIVKRRAERQEPCLVPDIGFHEGQWWCEDEGERYIASYLPTSHLRGGILQ